MVENKNQELRTLISQYQHKQLHGNINLLSMCLNGVIDAAVNGGIARYQEVSGANSTKYNILRFNRNLTLAALLSSHFYYIDELFVARINEHQMLSLHLKE